MTATLAAASPSLPEPAAASSGPPLLLNRQWLAALAVVFVFAAPYQTLVQTVITDDAVRKGLNIDDYDMTWQQVGYGVGIIYGIFAGLGLSTRIGARYTIALGLVGFALGNVLCGAAVGLESFVLGRFVDGQEAARCGGGLGSFASASALAARYSASASSGEISITLPSRR